MELNLTDNEKIVIESFRKMDEETQQMFIYFFKNYKPIKEDPAGTTINKIE